MAALTAASALILFLFTFRAQPAALRFALSLPGALAALGLLHSAFRPEKSFLLDISGLGEIRLREHYTGAAAAWWKETTSSSTPVRKVRLMAASTLWTSLLVLRLQDEAGRQTSLVVLPDSLAPGAFRALSLSLRCIAREGRGALKQL